MDSARAAQYLDALGVDRWVLRRVADADAVGVADDTWSTLRAEVSGCTRCALSSTRTQTVFGVGDERARWLIVGEAPGAEEDRRGEPFVGPAGQL